MFKQKTRSKDIDLSFDFKINDLENRNLHISVLCLLRKLDNNSVEDVFTWFMEDLVLLIEKNQIQKRWDFENILISGLGNLELTDSDYIEFVNKFKTVTNWNVIEVKK